MGQIGLPVDQGLYDPGMEKDSCGVGFIAHVKGQKTHDILTQGLQILKRLKHRGAVGADASTGDGAGILIQIPHDFLVQETKELGFTLPEPMDYAVGMVFLPQEPNARLFCEGIFERILREEGQKLLGWREVPINENACGISAKATRPVVSQIFIGRGNQPIEAFKRKLLVVRKSVQNAIRKANRPYTDNFYVCSLSMETIVYKGQILGYMLEAFYTDLQNELVKTAVAVVHERYSTNTFPSWKLAHPFRYVAHNGEINTLRGNINWMNAREGVMYSPSFGEDFKKILPVIEPEGSDSSSLDNIFELFLANGHPLEHVMMMLIPEAWQENNRMDRQIKGFYEYHARIMESWDGPAALVFTDGNKIGATMDRNGLRPLRYTITKDDFVIMASETGVIDVAPDNILQKGSLKPSEMIVVDMEKGWIFKDQEIKKEISGRRPYAEWIGQNKLTLDDLEAHNEIRKMNREVLLTHQKVFGYTEEELQHVVAAMAESGEEPISAMGIDMPLAILSSRPQLLFNYFKQKFAQVTNPPIDPIREKIVMSLVQYIGKHGQLLDEIEIDKKRNFIELKSPILKNDELERLRHLYSEDFKAITLPITFPIDGGKDGLKNALESLCKRAEENIRNGYNILVISDTNLDLYNAPIPSLLALGAVHHYLIRKKLRTQVDLVMECGDARDVMHMALLIGYGAKAVNPYMALESIRHMVKNKQYIGEMELEEAYKNYCNAIAQGLLKIISKMGISTLQSYHGAQIFEVLGIHQEVIDAYFTGTSSRLSGIGLELIAEEVIIRHTEAYGFVNNLKRQLEEGGEFFWKSGGEYHILNPKRIDKLQKACRNNNYEMYKEYAEGVNSPREGIATIRGLLQFKAQKGIELDEVEPVESIVKRFTSGAISFGSISKEAHETLAVAMNRLGGKSNSGEGGEDTKRYYSDINGNIRRSAVKQIASGRFGVTIDYLVNCDEIQIKMAQGAKPGEGGHLPGKKVTAEIAKIRHAIPGIDLISPPPHHDIYSIEDLAQLIFDLKNANPTARINVKLASSIGIGTIAAGVAKGYADAITICGHDGGTGAAPISSMKYVGMPWELGLAETQQTLLLNDLRSRVTLQVDGKMSTGRDVVVAALLGAEEYGFSTACLIASGCIMCKKCNLNKCPVGIATQETKLREGFKGKPEHIIAYFNFVAQEVREIMAELGFRTIDEMIGRVDILEPRMVNNHKAKHLDIEPILYRPDLPSKIEGKCTIGQKNQTENVLDRELIQAAAEALLNKKAVAKTLPIANTNRSIGAMLSGVIAQQYGYKGLPEDTIQFDFIGSAGQSFGAFGVSGLTLRLEGDANDYLGKGLSGGKIIVTPPKGSSFPSDKNVIAGNTLLYGATSGEVYINGMAGGRFAVRNSGATAVIEGIGSHGCQYMTGGIAVILGEIGDNFGAGMSGGIAYILDEAGDLSAKVNPQMVTIESLAEEDVQILKGLLQKHVQYTGSAKAKEILEHWKEYGTKIFRVSSPSYLAAIRGKESVNQAV
ncbi:glutamate synthase (NADPH/NADH) large chain [Geosporobacter subterraneus DSM 17957]|uniref:Glutamate synthase (NADPH/NADH) large chain n=1 Tax=Geosporobacter subterraneus DSM 17957 TaxID=1121919 RepID=A0A1M6NUG1_9FIRM|nr:glutamate synthase large subunit [Geosporobacter subterraneus]SHJ99379.1 glutamate synthase (NADPH/NADH) large chain [Geosporobacter subterraneus DSM 17957]